MKQISVSENQKLETCVAMNMVTVVEMMMMVDSSRQQCPMKAVDDGGDN